MEKNSLVILRVSKVTEYQTDTLYPNKFYRCMKLTEGSVTEYMVYGIVFDEKTFNEMFEYAYDRVMRDWTTLGLIVNGKAVSKTKFKECIDFHVYVTSMRRSRGINLGIIRNHDFIYGFYPRFGETKKETFDNAYKNFVSVSLGEMTSLDNNWIQLGNMGVPLSFGNLSWR